MRVGAGIRLGRFFGVEARADWSLLVVFALVVVNLGAGLFPSRHPGWSPALSWGLALIAACLFFASVYAHELGHALCGRSVGVPVHSITLFIFGGVAATRTEPPSPRAELIMAAAGPATSLVIGGLSTAIGVHLLGDASALTRDPLAGLGSASPVAALLLWLGPVNIVLALFNLIPGYPLDGGRVLRALLWWLLGDLGRATRWAAGVGQGFGLALIVAGVSMVFGIDVPLFGSGLGPGIWLAFIGWFLSAAARASYQRSVFHELLAGVKAGQLMSGAPAGVDPTVSVAYFVDRRLLGTDERAFPVVEGGTLVGLVCLEDVRKIPRPRWHLVDVRKIMTPWSAVVSVKPDESAADAFDRLSAAGVGQVPVLVEGGLVGMLRRRDLLRWLEVAGGGLQSLRDRPA